VKHFVVEDILNDELRNGGTIHAAVEEDLVGAGIVTPELASPGASAPAEMRAYEISFEELFIQRIEHSRQIEKAALRIRCGGADTGAAHALNPLPSAMRASVFEVRLGEGSWWAAPIDSREQHGRSAFENGKAALAHQIRKTNVDSFFTAADGENKIGIRIKLNVETRRTAFAAETREDALEKCGSSGK